MQTTSSTEVPYMPVENPDAKLLHDYITSGELELVKNFLETKTTDDRIELLNDTTVYSSYFGTTLHCAFYSPDGLCCSCNLKQCTGDRDGCLTNCDVAYKYGRVGKTCCRKFVRRFDKRKMIIYLLEQGADPLVEDYYGLSFMSQFPSSDDTSHCFLQKINHHFLMKRVHKCKDVPRCKDVFGCKDILV